MNLEDYTAFILVETMMGLWIFAGYYMYKGRRRHLFRIPNLACVPQFDTMHPSMALGAFLMIGIFCKKKSRWF